MKVINSVIGLVGAALVGYFVFAAPNSTGVINALGSQGSNFVKNLQGRE